MDFEQATAYLLSLGNEVSTMKLGLENIRTLLRDLGDPQDKYLKVQVAGTNGKGSVCAFLNSICISAGINTGMYTSPHLISMTERVKINGEDIHEDDFARLATRVRSVSEDLVATGDLDKVPTFFEQVTAIALLAFAEAKVELAILETGLGGRLDATTAANADVVAITRIDLDHQQYLGETIEEIAAEKAAIINDQFDNVVIGAQSPEALEVILARCREFGTVPVGQRYSPWTVEFVASDYVRVETTRHVFPNVKLGLAGRHQIENAVTAINVIQSLRYDCGVSIEDDDIVAGLQNARHPGRLEFEGRFLFDGAHNIGGARALRDFVDEYVNHRITMIFGAMKDKNVEEITAILFPKANKLILTQPDNSRALSAVELMTFVPDGFDPANVSIVNNVSEAVERAKKVSTGKDLILVTGSLYLVGEVRQIVGKDTFRNN